MTREEARKRLEVYLICAQCPEDKECYNSYLHSTCEYNDCREEVSLSEAIRTAIKTLEQEPKTGHWIEIAKYSDGNHKIECSECKSHIFDRGHANSFNVKNKYKYCPNCGAKMVQESEVKE